MALGIIAGIATVASGVMGAVSGNQKAQAAQDAADDQADAAKEMAEWQWEETKRRESFNQYEVDIARINEGNVRHWRDRTDWDAYNRELYIRDYDYRSKVESYNASELAYAQQLDFNSMGARLAREEQALWIDEQLQQAAFQDEELSITSQKQYDDIALQAAKARDSFDIIRANTNLQHRSKSAEFAGKSLEGMLSTLKAKGQARARGQTGRTARKTVQAIGAIADFQQSMLNDMSTKSELAFSNQQEQNYMQYQQARASTRIERAFVDRNFEFGTRKIQATRDSAFKQHKSNMLRIEYDKYGADMQAEGRRQSPPPAYDELPPIPAPYFAPQTHIPDAYKTKKKPPGPPGAPNLMAGQGMAMASGIIGSVASGISAYNKYKMPSSGLSNQIPGSQQHNSWAASNTPGYQGPGGFMTNPDGSIGTIGP